MKKLLLALLLLAPLAHAEEAPDVWLQELIAPVFLGTNESIKRREWIEKTALTPELKRLMDRDAADSRRLNEPTRMNFDWIVGGQDIPESWKVGAPKPEGDLILVPVTTFYGKESSRHVFVLKPAKGRYVITDVRYPEETLLKILNAPLE